MSRDLFPRYFTVTDFDANLVAVAPALAAMIGYQQRELVPGTAFRMVNASDERRVELTQRLVVDGYLNDVASLRHRDGTAIPFEYSVKRWHDLYWLVGEPLEQPVLVPRENRLTYRDLAQLDRRTLLENGADADPWFTSAQAASYLQISRRTLLRWRDDGLLPTGGSKGSPRFRKSWLDKLRGAGGTALVLLVLVLAALAVQRALVVRGRPSVPRHIVIDVDVGRVPLDEDAEPVPPPLGRGRFPT